MKKLIKILFLGDNGVGKSYICKKLTGTLSPGSGYQRTNGIDIHYKTINHGIYEYYIQLWDTVSDSNIGPDTLRRLYSNIDCLVLVYDISSLSSFNKMKDTLDEYYEVTNTKEEDIPILVIGNKGNDERQVSREIAKSWACSLDTMSDYIEISAMDDNIDYILTSILFMINF